MLFQKYFVNLARLFNIVTIQMSRQHLLLYLLLILFSIPLHGQDEPGSNIVSRTFLSADGAKQIEQRVYDNGLGDIIQEVQSFPGSTLPSIFVHHEYDEYRRKVKTWLPVISSGSDFIKGKMINYYAGKQYDEDSTPFTRTEYDNFLPSQPSAQYKAGDQWQDNDKKVSITYSEYVGTGMFLDYYNDDEDKEEEEEDIYTLSNVKYLCTRTIDEDSCLQAEYTDLNGRVMITETSQGRTYYLYDLKGDIRYVIPPALSAYILSHYEEDTDVPNSDEMVRKYAYIYRYDNQRHCIYKKLPGCEPVYYVYDRAGRCILTQDGNQRQKGEWTYNIPDKFGRPCISGVCYNDITYSAEPLHSKFVYVEYGGKLAKIDEPAPIDRPRSLTDNISISATTGVSSPISKPYPYEDSYASFATIGGYTVHNIVLKKQTLYSATYYDDYSFIGDNGVSSSLTASSVADFPIDTSLGHGLQTGSATAVLNDGKVTGYTYSAMYYDSRYQVAQVRSTNHLGGTDITYTSYSFTGKPLAVKVLHTTGNSGTVEVNSTYTYDGADRKDSYTLSIAHGEPLISATQAYEYDELGRLKRNNRQSKSNVDLDIEYEYDLHGWLKNITTRNFSEELFYADGLGTPCYNGNISSVKWKTRGSAIHGYKYSYDNANRLIQGIYGEGDALDSYGKYNESVEYDAAGNIKAILRYGKTSPTTYGQMDRLILSYDGYQLANVSEDLKDHDFAGSFEYKQAKGSQYMYDKNGSMIADKSRGIAFIAYDVNNSPNKIYFTNGNVTKYVYSATGQKLRTVHYTAKPNITREFGIKPEELTKAQILYADSTDYLLGGNLIFKNGKIEKLLFDGGYALASATSPSTDKFFIYYYNQDHLGNIRVVEGQRGNVQQLTNYYPFGAPFVESSSYYKPDYQPYKYNGKELDLMHGLNTYDYGARQYDPILAKWDRVDPLAEKYYDTNPYTYCLNNPIKYVDIKGFAPGDFFRTVDEAAKDFGYCYNGNSIVQNREYGTTIFLVINSNNEIGYTYNIPSVGKENCVMIDNAPIGNKVVATAHTHGKFVEAQNPEFSNYNNEFSGIRTKIGGKILPIENRKVVNANNDIGNANSLKIDSYVVTPNGSLQKYNHKTGEITVISTDMPSDKNDPTRLNNRNPSNNESDQDSDVLELLRRILYQQY